MVDSDNMFSSQSLLNINIDTSSISNRNDVTPANQPQAQERMTIESQFQSRQELASNMEIDQSEKMGQEEQIFGQKSIMEEEIISSPKF